MSREVSVRELRNHTAKVVAALRDGEDLVLTSDRKPVADIVPHGRRRDPWRPSSTLREIVRNNPVDTGLLDDLAAVRDPLVDDG